MSVVESSDYYNYKDIEILQFLKIIVLKSTHVVRFLLFPLPLFLKEVNSQKLLLQALSPLDS